MEEIDLTDLVREFREIETLNPDYIKYFYSMDDLLLAAYDHVKKTGFKVTYFQDPKRLLVGLKTEDERFFLARLSFLKKGKKDLSMAIANKNIFLEDFINKQLMAFI